MPSSSRGNREYLLVCLLSKKETTKTKSFGSTFTIFLEGKEREGLYKLSSSREEVLF